MRRRGGANVTAVSELVEEAKREREEQHLAQIAYLSCELSLATIREGVRNTVLNLRHKPKTKYEYNKERVRDFRVNRATDNKKNDKTPLDLAIDELERRGKVSYQSLETDPPSFFRDFKATAYQASLKHMHRSFDNFARMEHVDLSQQVLGDERIERLCEGLRRSPVVRLNLSGNRITDVGLGCLARTQRSLASLQSLNLSWNNFTDAGMAILLADDHYSGSLRELDLTYNLLTATTAYHLGSMFQSTRSSELSVLRLGGMVGHKGWGDSFLQVLLHGIVVGSLSRLTGLHVSDFSLGPEGFGSLVGFLCCDDMRLQALNIARNPMPDKWVRNALLGAMTLQRQRTLIFAGDCCFEIAELQYLAMLSGTLYFSSTQHERRRLDRDDMLRLSEVALKGLNACQHAYRATRQEILNIWRTEQPPRWQSFVLSFPTDLRSNLEAALSQTSREVVFRSAASRDLLVRVNSAFKEVYSLEDLFHFARRAAVDTEDNTQHKSLHGGRLVEEATQRVLCAQRALRSLMEEQSRRSPAWHALADLVVQSCCQLFKPYAHLPPRRWGRGIELNAVESEQLHFLLEDALSRAIEHAALMQQLIARSFELKVLRIALTQVSLSASNKNAPTYQALVHKSLPFFDTLGPWALFTHYAYFAQHKERAESAGPRAASAR